MTEDEMQELRELLAQEAESYAKNDDYIIDTPDRISASNALDQTSEAELLVFGIPREMVPTLQTAYMAYFVLEDLVEPSLFDERTTELIEKARAIMPPRKSFGRDIPFQTGISDEGFFQSFAKTFMDVPYRHATAIYAKHEFNTHGITQFADER
ncbi:hypothetical protein [Acidimangrovimonas pyrenivorans]|uniref:Uncharacterized protein n=1 Tax=Acidimangrovimonas pyrenivorans TaxID=2030798 RepID=A0ABV7AC16_9RHOB